MAWDDSLGKPTAREPVRGPASLAVHPQDADLAGGRDVAIVGMSGRFPRAANVDEFWRNLAAGIDAIRPPKSEDRASARFGPDVLRNPDYVESAYYLDDVKLFDAEFFGFTASEARITDPQHRIFMECVWEALESAGYISKTSDLRIGLYAGASLSHYLLHNLHASLEGTRHPTQYLQRLIGNDKDYLTTHVSYKLNLRGPSVGVQTACSTSLVALWLACQALADHECDLALAGGVTVRHATHKFLGYIYEQGNILSPDGHCRPFDASAGGTAFGSGAGVVVLKRLREAIADRDAILAVVKEAAVNNDGSVKIGFTAPSLEGQAEVVGLAQATAGVHPDTIGYVEAHGTGTHLGDPVEIAALTQVFRAKTTRQGFCAIGSVKSNVGHLESAAGVAGLIKTVLALRHKQIPPSLHFRSPNPEIDFGSSPFYVNTELEDWPSNGASPRRAAISSFGIGGTNAHAILEEAPVAAAAGSERMRPEHILTLSARDQPALRELADRYLGFLEPGPDVHSVCFTSNTGRRHFPHRLAAVGATSAELHDALAAFVQGQERAELLTGETSSDAPLRVAFLCTGQGAQYPGMGRQLYETQPVFRAALDRCAELLGPHLERGLLEVVHPAEPAAGLVDQTAYTQPALFALEYALAQLWASWGVRPAAVLGHSVGEYVAACLAGVFSLEEGLGLVAARGRLMQALPAGGAMVAVLAGEERVRAALAGAGGAVAVAAVNGPRHTVVSGPHAALEAALAPLAAAGVGLERLRVSHAFHSPLMEPMLADFRRAAARVRFSAPRLPVISNLTGEPAGAKLASPDYWVGHLRQTVQFGAGMEYLQQKGYRVFVEIGPQPVLLAMGRAVLSGDDSLLIPSLRQGRGDAQQILAALGTLFTAGVAVDWEGFERGKRRPRAILPSYPFQRVRHWYHEPGAPAHSTPDLKRPRASSVVDLLDRGDAHGLARLVETSAGLAEVDRAALERVVGCLVEQHQEHLPAADLYGLEWRAVGPVDQSQAFLPAGGWLIFADSGGLGQALSRGLRAQGHRCILVYRGADYPPDDDDARGIDPSAPGEFVNLIEELTGPLREVVYCWNLDAPPPAAEIGLLHLVQALAAGKPAQTRLWVVTRGAVDAGAKPTPVALSQAPSWGLGRVIALEHPELWGGLIDLDPEASAEPMAVLVAETCGQPGRGEQIAFRGGKRLVARLARTAPPDASAIEIRSDATYLIAGGLGALGLGLAKWMASQGARHLALTSRSGLTERTRERVRELENMGVRVLALAADAASEADMARVFADVAGSLPPLRGIVHAAGVLDDGILLQQSWERFERVMAPKVKGAWNLHRLSDGLELDFFVLFSSTAALLGSPGQGNYAAANAYLDALAAYRRACGQPGLSINWAPWADLGMAASLGNAFRKRMESRGLRLLAPAQAFRMFGTLLHAQVAQVAVMPIDWSTFKRQLPAGSEPPALTDFLEDEPAEATGRGRYAEELQSAPASERGALLTTYLQQRIAEVLGMAPPQLPAIDQGFADMGMDSLMTLDLKARLELDLGMPLSPAMVFNYPTIESLGAHLCDVLGFNDGGASPSPDAPNPVEEDLAALDEIRGSSDEELAEFIAREYDAHQ